MKLILLFTILFYLLPIHAVVIRADSIVRDVGLNRNVSSDGIERTSPVLRAIAGNCGDTSAGAPSYCSGTQSGRAFFDSVGLGACGIVNKDSDLVVAVSHLLFDTFPGYDGVNPSKNPVCGKKIIATFQGKSIGVNVVDSCNFCQLTDLDLSPSAFAMLADLSLGLIGITWVWA